mmetsp:Transcript_29081/g.58078  ORF Transcript_29081/g.58078 Transcript_29081/m.58078 type:complete len:138 (+) Transcript_29081:205-618(+)
MYPDCKADWTEAEKDLNMDIKTAKKVLDDAGVVRERIEGVKSTSDLFESDERARGVSISIPLSMDSKTLPKKSLSPKAAAIIEGHGSGRAVVAPILSRREEIGMYLGRERGRESLRVGNHTHTRTFVVKRSAFFWLS